MRVLVTEPDGIHTDAIELLRVKGFDVIVEHEISPDLKNTIDILFIRTYTIADKSFLEKYPKVKYILRAGVGLDNIDLDECKKRQITVLNAPGSNANAVAEFVVSLMIMLLRNTPRHTNLLSKGKWRSSNYLGYEIKGKIIGLVGCGSIGKFIAEKLQSFDVKNILGFDPLVDAVSLKNSHIIKVDLEYLLQNSDIVSLHVPLIKDTKHLISQPELNKMKKSAYLINTSRGGIVNEEDLIKALQTEVIAGAALDVFENEPEINKKLLGLSNIILTPHLGGYTQEADRQMSLMPVLKLLDNYK